MKDVEKKWGNFEFLKETLVRKCGCGAEDLPDLDLLIKAEQNAYLDIEKTLLYVRLTFEELRYDRRTYHRAKDFWRENIGSEDRNTLISSHNDLGGYKIEADDAGDNMPGNMDICTAALFLNFCGSRYKEHIEEACRYISLYAECCNTVHKRDSADTAETGIDLNKMEHLKLMYGLMLRKYSDRLKRNRIRLSESSFHTENIPIGEWNFIRPLDETVSGPNVENDRKALVFKNLYTKKNRNGTVEYAVISLFNRTRRLDHEYRALQILWQRQSAVDNDADFRGINDDQTENILIIRKYPDEPKALSSFRDENTAVKLHIMTAAAKALREIHDKEICHRNLTGGGILIYKGGQEADNGFRASFLSYIYAKIPREENVKQVGTIFEAVVDNNNSSSDPAAETSVPDISTDDLDWKKFDIFKFANIAKDFLLQNVSDNTLTDDLTALVELAKDPDPVQRSSLDDIIGQLEECTAKLN